VFSKVDRRYIFNLNPTAELHGDPPAVRFVLLAQFLLQPVVHDEELISRALTGK
jgi:hypothetical protein